jgi:hypothetical protein
MWKYLKMHEQFVRRALESGTTSFAELQTFHAKQLRFMQHERLIHLLVLLFVAVYLLLCIGFVSIYPSIAGFLMTALLLGLTAVYVVHYFRLENGVQRWYHLANRIDEKLGIAAARYNEEHPKSFL